MQVQHILLHHVTMLRDTVATHGVVELSSAGYRQRSAMHITRCRVRVSCRYDIMHVL